VARSIFDRYGGFAKVSIAVAEFYRHVLGSPQLAPYFDGIDMRRLMDHQTKFFAALMGGPASYTDEHLARVHAPLKIDDAAFDEMAGLLRETLEDLDYDETDISAVYAAFVARRPYLVTRPGSGLLAEAAE
jgi:hemoglobin